MSPRRYPRGDRSISFVIANFFLEGVNISDKKRQMSNLCYLRRVLLSLLICFVIFARVADCVEYPVSITNIFLVRVQIQGSKSDYERLIIDTGSPFTWLYNYKILAGAHGHAYGGYGTTALRTLIEAPHGGNVIVYADSDGVECDKWTIRNFTLRGKTWQEPFGIASVAMEREKKPNHTGLLGASRGSNFVKSFPVFGFNPMSPKIAEMFFDSIDPIWCVEGRITRFPLIESSRDGHWGSDAKVSFGESVFNEGFVLDTGSTVIALPVRAFYKFTDELKSRGIQFIYKPEKLYGVIDCSMLEWLPSWYIGDKSTPNHVRIQPFLYVEQSARSTLCIVNVAKVSANHPLIFGLPVTRNYVSEFSALGNTVGLCIPASSEHFPVDRTRTLHGIVVNGGRRRNAVQNGKGYSSACTLIPSIFVQFMFLLITAFI